VRPLAVRCARGLSSRRPVLEVDLSAGIGWARALLGKARLPPGPAASDSTAPPTATSKHDVPAVAEAQASEVISEAIRVVAASGHADRDLMAPLVHPSADSRACDAAGLHGVLGRAEEDRAAALLAALAARCSLTGTAADDLAGTDEAVVWDVRAVLQAAAARPVTAPRRGGALSLAPWGRPGGPEHELRANLLLWASAACIFNAGTRRRLLPEVAALSACLAPACAPGRGILSSSGAHRVIDSSRACLAAGSALGAAKQRRRTADSLTAWPDAGADALAAADDGGALVAAWLDRAPRSGRDALTPSSLLAAASLAVALSSAAAPSAPALASAVLCRAAEAARGPSLSGADRLRLARAGTAAAAIALRAPAPPPPPPDSVGLDDDAAHRRRRRRAASWALALARAPAPPGPADPVVVEQAASMLRAAGTLGRAGAAARPGPEPRALAALAGRAARALAPGGAASSEAAQAALCALVPPADASGMAWGAGGGAAPWAWPGLAAAAHATAASPARVGCAPAAALAAVARRALDGAAGRVTDAPSLTPRQAAGLATAAAASRLVDAPLRPSPLLRATADLAAAAAAASATTAVPPDVVELLAAAAASVAAAAGSVLPRHLAALPDDVVRAVAALTHAGQTLRARASPAAPSPHASALAGAAIALSLAVLPSLQSRCEARLARHEAKLVEARAAAAASDAVRTLAARTPAAHEEHEAMVSLADVHFEGRRWHGDAEVRRRPAGAIAPTWSAAGAAAWGEEEADDTEAASDGDGWDVDGNDSLEGDEEDAEDGSSWPAVRPAGRPRHVAASGGLLAVTRERRDAEALAATLPAAAARTPSPWALDAAARVGTTSAAAAAAGRRDATLAASVAVLALAALDDAADAPLDSVVAPAHLPSPEPPLSRATCMAVAPLACLAASRQADVWMSPDHRRAVGSLVALVLSEAALARRPAPRGAAAAAAEAVPKALAALLDPARPVRPALPGDEGWAVPRAEAPFVSSRHESVARSALSAARAQLGAFRRQARRERDSERA